jgi:hypothetical protein
MTPAIPALGAAFQLGIVVCDIEAAMQHWTQAFGVGPFIFMADTGRVPGLYRGKPNEVRLRMAFSYSGDLQIELIQPLDDAPSPYTDFLAAGREGIQHLAYYAADFPAACRQLEAGGLTCAYTIDLPREQVRYYEDPRQPATMVELVTAHALRRRFHAALAAMTKGWEGANPVRRYKSMRHFMEASGVLAG